jgi:hypothetical protein
VLFLNTGGGCLVGAKIAVRMSTNFSLLLISKEDVKYPSQVFADTGNDSMYCVLLQNELFVHAI